MNSYLIVSILLLVVTLICPKVHCNKLNNQKDIELQEPYPYDYGTEDIYGWILSWFVSITRDEAESTNSAQKPQNKLSIDGLNKHNRYRECHNAKGLVNDERLNEAAQKWADTLQSLGNGEIRHSENNYGENIAWSSKTDYDVNEAIRHWYAENKNYNFTTGQSSNGKVIGHFTQVVWKSTQRVGFGISSGKNGTYIVANYYPAGNVEGMFIENVNKKACPKQTLKTI